MNHTPQIKKAIQFAARKHHGHLRQETEPLPYITHLFSVALLVAEDGSGNDVVCAALLHDTIEDTETTHAELAEAFNANVADLVFHVSEQKEVDGKKCSWRERKEAYLEHLKEAPQDALRIAIADKVDNIESKLEAYALEGPILLARWKQPTAAYLWYHGEALNIALTRLPEHPLTRRLAEACKREQEVLGTSVTV